MMKAFYNLEYPNLGRNGVLQPANRASLLRGFDPARGQTGQWADGLTG